jgi:hypothetical protein
MLVAKAAMAVKINVEYSENEKMACIALHASKTPCNAFFGNLQQTPTSFEVK